MPFRFRFPTTTPNFPRANAESFSYESFAASDPLAVVVDPVVDLVAVVVVPNAVGASLAKLMLASIWESDGYLDSRIFRSDSDFYSPADEKSASGGDRDKKEVSTRFSTR